MTLTGVEETAGGISLSPETAKVLGVKVGDAVRCIEA